MLTTEYFTRALAPTKTLNPEGKREAQITERLTQILAVMEQDRDYTAKEIAELIDRSECLTRKSINTLCDMKKVKKVGTKKISFGYVALFRKAK